MSKSRDYISAKFIQGILIFAIALAILAAEPARAQSKRASAADINAYLNSELLPGRPRRSSKVDVVGSGFFTDFSDNVRITASVPELQLSDTQSGGRLWRLMSGSSGAGSLNIYDHNAGQYRLTIDTSGNVGIGTTSPTRKLDVDGGNTSDGSIRAYTSGGTTSYWAGLLTAVGNNSASFFVRQIDTTDYLQIGSLTNANGLIVKNSGNVGIGTTSPADRLVIRGPNGNGALEFGNNTFAGGLFGNSMLSYDRVASAYKDLRIVTDGSNATVVVQAGGNVGIGTSSPQRKFEVAGITRFTASETVGDGNDAVGAGPYRAWYNGTITRGWAQQLSGNNNLDFWYYDGNWNKKATIDTSGNMTLAGSITAKYQDVAEWVPSSEQLPAGTVVVLDSTKSNQVISSSRSYDTRVAGVISEQPGIALGEKSDNKVLVATTGRVRVKVDASKGPIHIGDLLVTSDVPGVAMKSEPLEFAGRKMHMPGTLIGKALDPLEKGSGEILVLLSLQ